MEAKFWFSAIHVYNSRNHLFDCRAFAEASLPTVLHQAVAHAARPNLTLLRSTAVRVDLANKTTEYGEMLDRASSQVEVGEPLPVSVGFRRLQQGSWSIPIEEGQPFAALGFLGASAHGENCSVRVRVDAVLALDLEPLSPTFGTWRHDDQWIEGAVDVANLGETTVIAKVTVL